MLKLYVWPPPVAGVLVSAGSHCATAGNASAHRINASHAQRLTFTAFVHEFFEPVRERARRVRREDAFVVRCTRHLMQSVDTAGRDAEHEPGRADLNDH